MTDPRSELERLVAERIRHCARFGMTAVSFSVEEMRQLFAILQRSPQQEGEALTHCPRCHPHRSIIRTPRGWYCLECGHEWAGEILIPQPETKEPT